MSYRDNLKPEYQDVMDKYFGFLKLREAVQEERTQRQWWHLPKVPEVPSVPIGVGAAIFTGIAVVGIGIGATIGTYVFFGCVTLAGVIAVAESNKFVKAAIARSNKFVDFSILMFTLWATITLGITVTAAWTVAGLGFTLVYAPWLRANYNKHIIH